MRYAFVRRGAGRAWLGRPLPPSLRRKLCAWCRSPALVAVLAPVLAPPATASSPRSRWPRCCYSFAADVDLAAPAFQGTPSMIKLVTARIVRALCCLSAAAHAQPARYQIDPEHFSVGFLVDHLGYAKVLGMFRESTRLVRVRREDRRALPTCAS